MISFQGMSEQGYLLNILWTRIEIVSYECKSTASCLSNLIDVFIPCEIFSNINPEIGMIVSFL